MQFEQKRGFFIFDNICFDQAQNHGYYYIDSEEGFYQGRD